MGNFALLYLVGVFINRTISTENSVIQITIITQWEGSSKNIDDRNLNYFLFYFFFFFCGRRKGGEGKNGL